MDNAFKKKVQWCEKRKTEQSGNIDKQCSWKSKGETLKPENTVPAVRTR